LHALTGTQVVAAPLHATFSLPLRKKLDKKNKKYKKYPDTNPFSLAKKYSKVEAFI
jgi:hypothetical protein